MNKIADAHEIKQSELQDDVARYAKPNTTYIPPINNGPTQLEKVVVAIKGIPFWAWCSLGGAAAVGLITWLVFVFFLNTHPVTVTVESFTWERKIAIEAYEQRRQDGWSTPSDAYDINRSSRIHHYDQVYSYTSYYQCGTADRPRTCSTDHYTSVAVYRTWYDYTVDRWEFDYWVIAHNVDKNPQWPKLPTTLDTANVLGNERESSTRKESYKVITNKGYVLSVKLPVYLELEVGSTGTANVNRQNDVRSVNWDLADVVSASDFVKQFEAE